MSGSFMRSTDPAGQFAWLTQQLSLAQNNSEIVYIFGHLSPGPTQNLTASWMDSYIENFIEILLPQRNIIAALMFGHNLRDSIQLPFMEGYLPSEASEYADEFVAPIFLAPGMTPRAGKDPSFRLYMFNGMDKSLKDYIVYEGELNLTYAVNNSGIEYVQEYGFAAQYNMKMGLTPTAMIALYEDFTTLTSLSLQTYYYEIHERVAPRFTVAQEICAMTQFLSDAAAACFTCPLCAYPPKTPNLHLLWLLVIPGVCLILLFILGLVWWRRRLYTSVPDPSNRPRLLDD